MLHVRSKRVVAALTLGLLLGWGEGLLAEVSTPRLSQSVEGPAGGEAEQIERQLELAPLDEAGPMTTAGAGGTQIVRRLQSHPDGRAFSIFDAHTVLSWDDDDDGFYHRLRVSFDADVDAGEAWVYARLYLSLEGGPWNHYFTTEVFPITGDVSDDAYEVVTRLLDGYPTGYYDVLIELYDADYDLLVVNFGPYEDRDLAVLPLEDSYRDSYYESDGGGGALGPGLLVLALFGLIRGVSLRRVSVGKALGDRLN